MAACAANLGKHPQVPVQRPIVARSLESLHLTGPTSASGHKTKPERATYRVERCCAIEHDPTRLGRRNEACSCLVLSTLTTTATARRLVPRCSEKAQSNLEPRAPLCRSLFPAPGLLAVPPPCLCRALQPQQVKRPPPFTTHSSPPGARECCLRLTRGPARFTSRSPLHSKGFSCPGPGHARRRRLLCTCSAPAYAVAC